MRITINVLAMYKHRTLAVYIFNNYIIYIIVYFDSYYDYSRWIAKELLKNIEDPCIFDILYNWSDGNPYKGELLADETVVLLQLVITRVIIGYNEKLRLLRVFFFFYLHEVFKQHMYVNSEAILIIILLLFFFFYNIN